MKLSTKTTYGTKALLNIASRQGQGPVLLKDVAREEQIPRQYLEQVVTPLRIAGLLNSVRGAGGGFVLAKQPSQITLGEVVQILEGSLSLVECVDSPEACARSAEGCVTRDLWRETGSAVKKGLNSLTLQDLIERQRDKLQNSMYQI